MTVPIDDDYLEELIRRWTASVKDISIDDWTKEAQQSRIERYRRRRRRARIRGLVVGLVVCAAVFLALRFLAG